MKIKTVKRILDDYFVLEYDEGYAPSEYHRKKLARKINKWHREAVDKAYFIGLDAGMFKANCKGRR